MINHETRFQNAPCVSIYIYLAEEVGSDNELARQPSKRVTNL